MKGFRLPVVYTLEGMKLSKSMKSRRIFFASSKGVAVMGNSTSEANLRCTTPGRIPVLQTSFQAHYIRQCRRHMS